MIQSPEIQARIAELRDKARNGNALTLEECREAVHYMREGRVRAAETSAKSKTRSAAAKAKPDGDALLNELEGL